jgi:predicted TIM-barrel fold metal-dependent hydrolase
VAVDPHHHLWDARAPLSGILESYGDEDGNAAEGELHVATGRPGGGVDPVALGWQHRCSADDIVAEVLECGHNIVATVFLECGAMYRAGGPVEMQCVGETEWVHGVAAQAASGAYGSCRICAGIVPTADLTLGAAVEPVLQAHMAASSNLRGIRGPYTAGSCAKFAETMALFEKYSLVFDLGAPFDKLHEAIEIARVFPKVIMVLNHCGELAGPSSFNGSPSAEEKWCNDIVELGKLPNVFAKVGGCTMTYNGWGFDNRDVPIGSEELAELTYPL